MTRLSLSWCRAPRRVVEASILALCGAGCTEPLPPSYGGNVLVVVVDSLRADSLGLDLGSAVTFRSAYTASSYTSQAVAALVTGRLPTSGGSIGLLEAEPAQTAETLQQRFRRAGYGTGLVSNQGLLARRGFSRGFEDIQVASLAEDWPASEVTRRALDFVDSVAEERWLLYVHYADPHQPYNPPAEFLQPPHPLNAVDGAEVSVRGLQTEIEASGGLKGDDPRLEALVRRYRGEVAFVAASFKRLLAGLEERGLGEKTALVLTASQGEELGEHGWLGHAWTLYQEVVHVPLRLAVPNLAAQTVDGPVSLVDVAPSLLTLAGISYDDGEMDGDSLLVREPEGLRVRTLAKPKISELVIRERCIRRAVVQGQWKYIRTRVDCPLGQRRAIAAAYPQRVKAMAEGTLETPALWGEAVVEELYHLGRDPGETSNLAAQETEVTERMRRVLDNYQAHCREHGLEARAAVVPAEMADPATTERLQSLGYL